MQVSLLNLLLGTPAAGGSSVTADGGGGSNAFAQLLGGDLDFSPGQQGQRSAASAPLAGELVTGALTAQEVGQQQARGLLNQEITAEDAAQLVTDITALISEGGLDSDQQQAFEQLKEALEEVAESGEPASIQEIIAEVPDVDMLIDAPEDAAEHSTIARMLAFFHHALDKKREIALQANADVPEQAALAALGGGLQAIMFRAGAEPLAKENTQKAKEITTETIDVSAAVTPPAVPVSNPYAPIVQIPSHEAVAASYGDTQALDAEEFLDVVSSVADQVQTVTAITPLAQSQTLTLDTVIPPLALEGDDALPVVTLPQISIADDAIAGDADAAIAAVASARPITPLQSKISAHEAWLNSLPFPIQLSDAARASATPSAKPPTLEPLPDTVAAKEFVKLLPGEAAIAAESSVKADPGFGISLSTPATYTRPAIAPTAVPAQPALPASPADQVQVAITRAAEEGVDRITIQLEPADLGRVEIRMEVGEHGRTHMVFTADKSSTLDALSRGAYGLERSLADAGIKTDAGTMEFNLRQPPQSANADSGQHGQPQRQHSQNEHAPTTPAARAADIEELSSLPATEYLTLKISAGVDIEA